ncbi:hypothetical protein K2Z84_14665 [Candidatus Binatia bacterium]|jgi:hypothetical protein|nr:hypothetical protein [Candidatus Binatia bacterium]
MLEYLPRPRTAKKGRRCRPDSFRALVVVAGLAAALLAAPAARAQEATPEAATDSAAAEDAWHVSFVPYLWITEVHGSVRIGDLHAPIDVGFDKVFDLMGNGDLLGGMGYLEARKDRLILFTDATGSVVRTKQNVAAGKADLAADFATLEFGLGWRVYEGFDAITVDALAGGRYNYLYNSIDVTTSSGVSGPGRNATVDFVDPFVGGRWAVELVDGLSLLFRGDIGGFGAGSQLAWSLLGGFRYETPWSLGPARLNAFAAYKVYDFDYDSGSGSARRSIAEEYRGPALGLGAAF